MLLSASRPLPKDPEEADGVVSISSNSTLANSVAKEMQNDDADAAFQQANDAFWSAAEGAPWVSP